MSEADRIRLAARVPSDYVGWGYNPIFADDMKAVAGIAADVAGAAGAAVTATASQSAAAASAIAAQASSAAAAAAVAAVTVGSTTSLAYPEVIKNLVTAADVVEVLVYDTRMDSDGGAWTDRCSGTSWFQETLNTATRGAKRGFPKVALIVGQKTTLTIYDALDLDGSGNPRMWMVFEGADTKALRLNNSTTPITHISAMNGKIVTGSVNGLRVLTVLDFAEDCAINSFSGYTATRPALVLRNSTTAPSFVNGGFPTLASGSNGSDMRVMPGAVVSAATGLPIPTIMMATTANLTILHPLAAGQARASLVTLSGGYLRARFTPDNRIIAIGATAPGIADVGPVPYAATVANSAWRTHRVGSSAITATGGVILPDANLTAATLVDLGDGVVAQGSRLALIADDAGDPSNSLVTSIGNTFNTGWMPQGRTVVASLCEGVTGNATASGAMIANGTFATGDLTGFTNLTNGAGTATVVSGVLELYRLDTSNMGMVSAAVTTIIGESYRIAFTQIDANPISLLVGTSAGGSQVGTATGTNGVTTFFQFVAVGTTTYAAFRAGGNGLTAKVDNISCTLVSSDRTGNNNGLSVVGTLARTAVNTGNDLAAYSGFSAANYLTQPYNAGLDFGTGDFCVAGWANWTGAAFSNENMAVRGYWNGSAYSGARFQVIGAAGDWRVQVLGGSSVVAQAQGTSDTRDKGWTHVVGLRRAGVLEIWVNGIREGTAANVTDLTNTLATLNVGADPSVWISENTSLAMVRIASYAPTPAQIARMFRDEAPLFRAGVKAFLGGASTATVNRVARSRFSNRVAVAMSDGVAVMDGLTRVDRQTTGTLSPAMASNSTLAVGMEAGLMLVGTSANAGVRRDAIIGLDRMAMNTPPPVQRALRVQGVTTDATPLVLAPRIPIGERELVVIRAIITGRVYGAADGQSLTYVRQGTYYRDAGGNVTLRGSVQVIGTDVEVTGTADATLVIDTTAQTVSPQVTGIAATRLVWVARIEVERNTRESTYEEII